MNHPKKKSIITSILKDASYIEKVIIIKIPGTCKALIVNQDFITPI